MSKTIHARKKKKSFTLSSVRGLFFTFPNIGLIRAPSCPKEQHKRHKCIAVLDYRGYYWGFTNKGKIRFCCKETTETNLNRHPSRIYNELVSFIKSKKVIK